MDPHTPVTDDKVRFVCLSDTHDLAHLITEKVPDGDVLLHAGDFTNKGRPKEVNLFNEFLGRLPHKYKIVIAGNADLSFDDDLVKKSRATLQMKLDTNYLESRNMKSVKELMTNCIYLEDTVVEIYGIKIYGSPWIPKYRVDKYCGFTLSRGEEISSKWSTIPENVDILMTHGPPRGHGDKVLRKGAAGCVDLMRAVQRVKPLYHVFGHIHEGYGVTSNGDTTFINASNCTKGLKIQNPPVVFDISLPEGRTKQDIQETNIDDVTLHCNKPSSATVTPV